MLTIAQYRDKHGLTLEAFAELIGKSKPHVHEIQGTMRCSAKLALVIEEKTAGEINAAALNDEIAAARSGLAA